MQPQLGIWKRFNRSLLGVDRCSLSWASGRGLLAVYWGWTDAASAGDQEDMYRYYHSQAAICSSKVHAGSELFICLPGRCGVILKTLDIWFHSIHSAH